MFGKTSLTEEAWSGKTGIERRCQEKPRCKEVCWSGKTSFEGGESGKTGFDWGGECAEKDFSVVKIAVFNSASIVWSMS